MEEDIFKTLKDAAEKAKSSQTKDEFVESVNKTSAALQNEVKGMSENEFKEWTGNLMDALIGGMQNTDKQKLKENLSQFIAKNKNALPPIPEGKNPLDFLFKQ